MKWHILHYIVAGTIALGIGAMLPAQDAVPPQAEVKVSMKLTSGAFDQAAELSQDANLFSGHARVIDGDTLALGETRIRLHGIDAPELAQTCTDTQGATWTCGAWSTAVLQRLASSDVSCLERDLDRYSRIVAVCFADGIDINAAMVEQGAAYAYVQYSSDYSEAQNRARQRSVGLWRAGAQSPAAYRAQKRSAQVQARIAVASVAPQGCEIKGNISKSGQLYHVPGGRWYERTRVNEASGERWFCSEHAAQAAGWRAAQS